MSGDTAGGEETERNKKKNQKKNAKKKRKKQLENRERKLEIGIICVCV